MLLAIPVLMLMVSLVLWAGASGRAQLSSDLAAEEGAKVAALCMAGSEKEINKLVEDLIRTNALDGTDSAAVAEERVKIRAQLEASCSERVDEMVEALPGLADVCIGDPSASHASLDADGKSSGDGADDVEVFSIEHSCTTDGTIGSMFGLFPTMEISGRGSEVMAARFSPRDVPALNFLPATEDVIEIPEIYKDNPACLDRAQKFDQGTSLGYFRRAINAKWYVNDEGNPFAEGEPLEITLVERGNSEIFAKKFNLNFNKVDKEAELLPCGSSFAWRTRNLNTTASDYNQSRTALGGSIDVNEEGEVDGRHAVAAAAYEDHRPEGVERYQIVVFYLPWLSSGGVQRIDATVMDFGTHLPSEVLTVIIKDKQQDDSSWDPNAPCNPGANSAHGFFRHPDMQIKEGRKFLQVNEDYAQWISISANLGWLPCGTAYYVRVVEVDDLRKRDGTGQQSAGDFVFENAVRAVGGNKGIEFKTTPNRTHDADVYGEDGEGAFTVCAWKRSLALPPDSNTIDYPPDDCMTVTIVEDDVPTDPNAPCYNYGRHNTPSGGWVIVPDELERFESFGFQETGFAGVYIRWAVHLGLLPCGIEVKIGVDRDASSRFLTVPDSENDYSHDLFLEDHDNDGACVAVPVDFLPSTNRDLEPPPRGPCGNTYTVSNERQTTARLYVSNNDVDRSMEVEREDIHIVLEIIDAGRSTDYEIGEIGRTIVTIVDD